MLCESTVYSFLLLNSIPLCGIPQFIYHLLMDILVGSSFGVSKIKLHMYKFLYKYILSFLLGKT